MSQGQKGLRAGLVSQLDLSQGRTCLKVEGEGPEVSRGQKCLKV